MDKEIEQSVRYSKEFIEAAKAEIVRLKRRKNELVRELRKLVRDYRQYLETTKRRRSPSVHRPGVKRPPGDALVDCQGARGVAPGPAVEYSVASEYPGLSHSPAPVDVATDPDQVV